MSDCTAIPKLLPCPFCGGEAVLVPTSGTTVREWFVTCGNLECGVLACKTRRFYSEEEAIEAWNTRAERTCNRVPFGRTLVCSECGAGMGKAAERYVYLNYCPHCGAKVVDA